MIYLDANIFVYALGNIDKKTERCIKLLNDVIQGKIEAYTSTLTWDEFVHVIKKQMNKEEVVKESSRFLNFPNLIFIDVNYKIISKAQEFLHKYNLKPRDAIHAATAITHNIKKIASDDSDFDRVKEIERIF